MYKLYVHQDARKLTEAVFSCGVIPSDWEENFILNPYNGMSKALGCGTHRDFKLKLLEQVPDSYIRGIVNIDDIKLALCLVEVPLTPFIIVYEPQN